MSDLVETLREQAAEIASVEISVWGNTMSDAADEIKRLRAELETERTCNESLQVALTNLRAFYPPACGADRLIAEALTANAAQTSDRGEEE